MTPKEWQEFAVAALDRLDDAELEGRVNDPAAVREFMTLVDRFSLAQGLWANLSLAEFQELDVQRHRRGKLGRPKRSSLARADEPLWKAVRDAERLKDLWRSVHPRMPRPRPPIHPHEIAAHRHGVSVQVVNDNARRSGNRKPNLTPKKD